MTLFNVWNQIKQSINNKKGQGMVEYALILAAIAVVVMVALTPVGTAIVAKFNSIAASLGYTAPTP